MGTRTFLTIIAASLIGCNPTSTVNSLPTTKSTVVVRMPETVSGNGKFSLYQGRVYTHPLSQNDSAPAVDMHFVFVDHDPQPALGQRLFLENSSTFRRAVTDDGRVLISNRDNLGWTENFGASVTIHDLPLGGPTKALSVLELSVPVVHLPSFETLEFNNLTPADSGYLHCGPFELVCHGDEKSFTVVAGSFADFGQEHSEFQRRVPLKFLHHRYAIEFMKVVDASGKPLMRSMEMGQGVSTSGIFSQRDPNAAWRTGFAAGKKIDYPVSITLHLPEVYTIENVQFRVPDIKIPPMGETIIGAP